MASFMALSCSHSKLRCRGRTEEEEEEGKRSMESLAARLEPALLPSKVMGWEGWWVLRSPRSRSNAFGVKFHISQSKALAKRSGA